MLGGIYTIVDFSDKYGFRGHQNLVKAAKLMVFNVVLIGIKFSFLELLLNELIQIVLLLHGENSMPHVSAEDALQIEVSDSFSCYKILMDTFQLN